MILGLNGLVVGILNSYEHFTIPALAPLVWNIVIIVLLVGLKPLFDGPNQLYAYAIAVLIATVVQLLMSLRCCHAWAFTSPGTWTSTTRASSTSSP